jgi:hypothetical protein
VPAPARVPAPKAKRPFLMATAVVGARCSALAAAAATTVWIPQFCLP